ALIVVAVSPAFPAVSVETRMWTWRTGETFEAELVDFDSVVEMREPNGKVFGMSIGDLSDADQKYLAERRVELAGGPATDGFRFRPRVDWHQFDGRPRIRV